MADEKHAEDPDVRIQKLKDSVCMLQNTVEGMTAKFNRCIGDPAASDNWYLEMAKMGGDIIGAFHYILKRIDSLSQDVERSHMLRMQDRFLVDGTGKDLIQRQADFLSMTFPLSRIPCKNLNGDYDIEMYVNGICYFDGNEFELCPPKEPDGPYYCKWNFTEMDAFALNLDTHGDASDLVVIEYLTKVPLEYEGDFDMPFYRPTLEQIEGGKQLLKDVENLKLSVKQFEKLANKTVKDIVRVRLTAHWATDSYMIALPQDFNRVVPNIKNGSVMDAYYMDNTPVLDTLGAQIKVQFLDGVLKFVGDVAELDVDASADTKDNTNVYQKRQDNFDFKIFPVGTFTLSTLPDDYLIDNTELQATAYQQAVNKLSVDNARNINLINALKKLVGTDSVQSQIQKEMKNIKPVAADNQRTETFALAATPTTTFTLADVPSKAAVTINVNGLVYEEDADIFTVDRPNKTITWTGTEANDGFELTTDIAPEIAVHYYVSSEAEQKAGD